MAKTRLQAKYSSDPVDAIEAAEGSVAPTVVVKKEKYSGAIDCLSQVYREKGLGGWYQVRFPCLCLFQRDVAGILRYVTSWLRTDATLVSCRECKPKSLKRSYLKLCCSESRTLSKPVRNHCCYHFLSPSFLPSN